MRNYQIWADGLQHSEASSLALALSNAYTAAKASPNEIADVYQGSAFTASVDVSPQATEYHS